MIGSEDRPPAAASAPPSLLPILALGVLILLCLGGVALAEAIRPTWIQELAAAARSLPVIGSSPPLVFLGVASLGVAIGVPRLLFSALAGQMFGALPGTGLAMIGTLLGSWLTFLAGRHLARRHAAHFVARHLPRAQRWLSQIGERTILSNVLIRMVPVGNCFVVNLLFSLSPARTLPFLLGTALGVLPETLIYALLGSAWGRDPIPRVLLAVCLLAALGIGHILWRRREQAVAAPVATEAV